MAGGQGTNASTTANVTARYAAVVFLTAWALLNSVPDGLLPWHPYATFGLSTDSGAVVTAVSPGSPAARAGIRAGERIDLNATAPQDRRYVTTGALEFVSPGTVAHLALRARNGALRIVALRAQIPVRSFADNLTDLIETLSSVVYILIGATLLLLRPRAATWGFFLSAVAFNRSSLLMSALPANAAQAHGVISALVNSAAPIGFILFALHFPAEAAGAFARRVQRLLPVAFVILCGVTLYSVIAPFYGVGAEGSVRAVLALQSALFLAAMAIFTRTYAVNRGQNRQRVQWVLFGLGFSFATFVALEVLQSTSLLPVTAPLWVLNTLASCSVALPITVAYAILKHHILDVEFVISRTVLFAVMTSGLAALFALIDWIFSKQVANDGFGTVVEIVTAIGVGLALNGMHRRVDNVLDRIFFRRRHRAEQRLSRIASTLPFAASRHAVAQSLVSEPADALQLSGAALFARTAHGDFAREFAVGGLEGDGGPIRFDDLLLMQLNGRTTPLRLADCPLPDGLPCAGAAKPVVCLPVQVRLRLEAVVFYGAHVHGEDLDPDEVAAIAALATGASAAFDHLEAAEMRRQIAELTRRLEAYGGASASV